MRGLFVTGTDTGVGKTVVSAVLATSRGWGYWKPIQTGSESDTAEVVRLAGCWHMIEATSRSRIASLGREACASTNRARRSAYS